MKNIILLFLVSAAMTAYTSDKCRVIALQGGGDKGSYQVGAFKALVSLLPKEERSYDLVSGVSVGAINGLVIALFAPGEEEGVSDQMKEYWLDIKSYKDVFVNWTIPILEGLWKPSLFDPSPSEKRIRIKLGERSLKRDFFVGLANRKTGKYEAVNLKDECEDVECLSEYILATSAIPGVFPPRQIQGNTYIDGGIINNIDVFTAVNHCKKNGFKEEDVVIDAIFCSPLNIKPFKTKGSSFFRLLNRVRQLFNLRRKISFIQNSKKAFPKVHFRHLIYPKEDLNTNITPIRFDPETINKYIDKGFEDGSYVINSK